MQGCVGAHDQGVRRDALGYCDCELLLDRAYFLPLGNRNWPNDTLVEFEYMQDEPPPAPAGAGPAPAAPLPPALATPPGAVKYKYNA